MLRFLLLYENWSIVAGCRPSLKGRGVLQRGSLLHVGCNEREVADILWHPGHLRVMAAQLVQGVNNRLLFCRSFAYSAFLAIIGSLIPHESRASG